MQLGFLSRSFFLDQVSSRDPTISDFLLLAILALAARFTAPLIKRFGGPKQASVEMHRRALSIIGEEMMEPTLERMQALFLLGVNDFGEGNGGRSWVSDLVDGSDMVALDGDCHPDGFHPALASGADLCTGPFRNARADQRSGDGSSIILARVL